MPKINLLKTSEDSFHSDETLRTTDGLKNDQLFYNLSRGSLKGITNYYSKAAVAAAFEEISLNHTITAVCVLTFSQAIRNYLLEVEVELEAYEFFIQDLIELNKKKQAGKFESKRFWESPLVQEYVTLLFDLLPDSISDNQKIRAKAYMKDYTPLFFTQQLSFDPTVRTRLQQFLEGYYHQAQLDKYSRDKYYTDLKHEYTSLTLNDANGMTLDHIYQEPGFSLFKRCLTEEKQKGMEEAFATSKDLGIIQHIHQFTNQWIRGEVAFDGLSNSKSRLLLLYGYPGQGKTSFCKRIVYDFFTDHPVEQSVFMVRFRNLVKPQLLKSEILSTIMIHFRDRFEISLHKKELEQSVLILDGLDELLMKNNLKTSDVDEIIRSLIYEVKLYPELRIIVTSRHGYLNHEELKTSELLVLSLNEFDLKLQKKWLTFYHQFHSECWLTLDKLDELNKSKNYLKELLGQPILLHMVAALDKDITDNVPNRAKVYEHLFKQLTDPKKWKTRQIDVLDGLTDEELRLALREIAFNVFKDGKGYIHKSQLEKLQEVTRLRNKLDGRGESFREALKVMMVAFYFQEIPKKNRNLDDLDNPDYAIEFLHKSLQEYLTAEYIWFTIQEEMLNRKPRGYVLEKGEDILKLLQSIFGVQVLSNEIVQYLVEVIQNDKRLSAKVELKTRFDEVFDFLIEKDFLHHFDAKKDKRSSSSMSHSNFMGFWSIYSSLDEGIYLFSGDDIERRTAFASFLRRITNVDNMPKIDLKLRSVDLSKVILRHVDLSFSDISTATFHDADLSYSFLSGASLPNANLKEANLFHAHLAHCDLRHCDFTFAHLYQVYLAHSDLTHAKLSYSELSNAYLFDVKLIDADLGHANLDRADLTGANLSGANLQECNLSRANLTNTIWESANLEGANLSYTVLKDAEDLLPEQLAKASNIDGIQGLSIAFLEEVNRIRNVEEDE